MKTQTPQPAPSAADHALRGNAVRTAGLLCAIALLWLTTRPYFGVVFDARFYMVEALHALNPARFAEDLYFKYGSQGNFSLFIKLYLPLLRRFDLSTTSITMTVAGQLLWLLGLFSLARSLVGGRIMWLSVAAVIGMLQIYAGGFGYGEAYVTARLFAEALVMLALSFLPSRPIWTIVLLGLAAAIHPLMALPGIAIALVYMALGRPIWWAVMVAGAALAAILGLVGVAPFSNLFRTIDPEWLAIINIRSTYCLIGNWTADYFKQTFGAIAWGIGALVVAGPNHRRFLTAVLVVGVGGLVCAYLGGDIAHNVLVVELQTWRSLWLLQLVSRLYIPLIFVTLLARTSLDSFRWATLLTMGLILASSVSRLAHYPHAAEFTYVSLALVAAALAVMAAQMLLTDPKYRRVVQIAALAGFALLPIALLRWDERSPWIRYLESPEPVPQDLAALLPAKASVYWESGLEMLWLRLKRPSYFACDQSTGAIFYREIAITYKHRADSFWPLRTGDFNQLDTCASFDKRPKPERNRKGLQNLCRREPELDYVMLTMPLDGLTPKVWKSPVQFQDLQSSSGKFFARVTDKFYIYACASVR